MSDDLFGDMFESSGGPATATAEKRDEQPAHEPQPVQENLSGTVVFDCETGPAESGVLTDMFEFDESKVKGVEPVGQPFDASCVKTGNMKDEAKIKQKIEQKRTEHEKAVAEATARLAEAREQAWLAFVERAPLSPLTGRVLAIGYLSSGKTDLDWASQSDNGQGEEALLRRWWGRFNYHRERQQQMIGHNIYGFDLPFLVRRSWLLGIAIPPEAFNFSGGRWSWNRLFVDTMAAWACGVYGERAKLDRLAQYFDTQRKFGNGANFARLFWGTPEERTQAFDYLGNDLEVTRQVAAKMGVL